MESTCLQRMEATASRARPAAYSSQRGLHNPDTCVRGAAAACLACTWILNKPCATAASLTIAGHALHVGQLHLQRINRRRRLRRCAKRRHLEAANWRPRRHLRLQHPNCACACTRSPWGPILAQGLTCSSQKWLIWLQVGHCLEMDCPAGVFRTSPAKVVCEELDLTLHARSD